MYMFLFDWKYQPMRGLTYLPVVILIAIATILLRYHYVVDVLAGVVIALFAFHIASRREGAS